MRTLMAWIQHRRVGAFTETPQADGSNLFSFEYEAPTDRDIVSLTMVPLADSLRFETRTFPPPFDMILPEGDRRARIEAARKILRTDSFSLLSYVGGNPVNRVRFLPREEEPRDGPPMLPPPAEIANSTRGRALFAELAAASDLRQGIAGVQPKALGAIEQRKLSPSLRQFRGSTHILKSSTDRLPFLGVNEYVCLEVFRRAGLRVPIVTMSADGELLLVQRFDIQEDGRCLGFEEAAALMGETSATKYQRDYGSMIESLSDFISTGAEVQARHDLVKALLLNHLIGNGDAHLKNFGVLYEDATTVSLAPFYDCVSTLPYIDDDVPALALSFDWYSKAWWPRVRIEEFMRDYAGLPQATIKAAIAECTSAVMEGVDTVAAHRKEIPGFKDLGERIARLWKDRVSSFMSEPTTLGRKGRPPRR
ncbi:MAG: type II toxin-antitoxin system HipA family toxin [Steroidobacteraceae bacterium]